MEGRQCTKYDFSEMRLNDLGYHYMGKDDLEKAIAVFKLNVEAFPNALCFASIVLFDSRPSTKPTMMKTISSMFVISKANCLSNLHAKPFIVIKI